MDHICTVCFQSMFHHPEECGAEACWVKDKTGREQALRHWPALCCPGCGCGSFEEAHGMRDPVAGAIDAASAPA